jgi:hypothetical protein
MRLTNKKSSRSTNKKNLVSFDNEDVKFYHFLIVISCPTSGPVGAVVITQAYTGYMTDAKEQSVFNAVERSCYDNELETGFRHEIKACGSLGWCLDHAKYLGIDLQ